MEVVLGILFIVLFLIGLFSLPHYIGKGLTLWQRARESRQAPTRREPREPVGESSPAARKAIDEVTEVALEISRTEHLSLELLERNALFQRHVDRLSNPDISFDELRRLAASDLEFAAAMALVAIGRRTDVPREWTTHAMSQLSSCPPGLEPFLYGSILERPAYPVIGPALFKLDVGLDWRELARFIEQRRERGEEIGADTFRSLPIRFVPTIESFLERFEPYLGEDFRRHFEEWRRTTVDVEFLSEIGRVLERPYDEPPAFLGGRRGELVELIVDVLEQKPRRSLLLVGEHGVGKSVLARAALERLSPDLIVFEARAADVNAGAIFVGELEGRVKELAAKLSGHDVVWLAPGFEEALFAGQHSRSPKGMLDVLLPYLERGEVTIVGELSPAAFENLLAERPRVAGAFEVVRVRPLDEAASVAAAEHVLAEGGVGASRTTLEESVELAQQFIPGLAPPGNVLRLVLSAAAAAQEAGEHEFDTSDVLAALAASSGLPLAMLDAKAPVDLAEIRRHFEQKVLAQPEAVDCIVERLSIIKAGLSDPTRPLGVFLFVGPTGTGKTEIAKALAEFLFGSQRRLIRLDMSEYQTPDALERLLSNPSVEQRGSVLLSSVRKDPFAVILLDEFEKAAPPVWDLFLQVFDDGRLTDQQGRTADFRRCVIIMTSNLGSALAHRPGVGFEAEHGRFREELIEKEVKRTFRPEFLNRLDRVVVFQPFQRAEMRALLEKELVDALARRGLRTRPWAIELDESASEFLIDSGFTPELGARPLKRALERHLLAPIASTIVEQDAPEGDQFLLVSSPSGERLEVTFVDPDAPEEAEREVDRETDAALDVRAIALSRRSDERTIQFLLSELRRAESGIHAELRPRKAIALAAMQEPGFWDDDRRHGLLAEAEYIDRLEAALATARKLGERLDRHSARNGGAGASELTGILSLRLHVLQAAVSGFAERRPADVFVRLRVGASTDAGAGAQWGRELETMYAAWARQRGMRWEAVNGAEQTFAVSGLGAGTILAPEAGLHVLEIEHAERDGRRELERITVLVELADWPSRPPGERTPLAEVARSAFRQQHAGAAVVRRYRKNPSPLVRDAVRGYRTGRLDLVLAGDFDLF